MDQPQEVWVSKFSLTELGVFQIQTLPKPIGGRIYSRYTELGELQSGEWHITEEEALKKALRKIDKARKQAAKRLACLTKLESEHQDRLKQIQETASTKDQ